MKGKLKKDLGEKEKPLSAAAESAARAKKIFF